MISGRDGAVHEVAAARDVQARAGILGVSVRRDASDLLSLELSILSTVHIHNVLVICLIAGGRGERRERVLQHGWRRHASVSSRRH